MGSTDKSAMVDTLIEALEGGLSAEELADGFAKALNKAQAAVQKKKEDGAELERLAQEAVEANKRLFEAWLKHKGDKVEKLELPTPADIIDMLESVYNIVTQ